VFLSKSRPLRQSPTASNVLCLVCREWLTSTTIKMWICVTFKVQSHFTIFSHTLPCSMWSSWFVTPWMCFTCFFFFFSKGCITYLITWLVCYGNYWVKIGTLYCSYSPRIWNLAANCLVKLGARSFWWFSTHPLQFYLRAVIGVPPYVAYHPIHSFYM